MRFEWYPHRFADIILNSDYALKQEMEQVIQSVSFEDVLKRFTQENEQRRGSGRKEAQGKQSIINAMFREGFNKLGWEIEKNVFNDPINDLTIDFWKRKVGIDVAFNHRSFISGDLLRLQAAAEVKNVINVGVYICATKDFVKVVSPKDASSMVSFERSKWYLENFYPVLTAPILLIGLKG
jgi:Restriction endonuclease BglII